MTDSNSHEKQIEELHDRIDQLESQLDGGESPSASRRQVMQGAGVLGLGALLGGGATTAATGTAAAAASDSDSDGDIGSASNRVDVFADGVDALSLSIESLSLGSDPLQAARSGYVVPVGDGLGLQDAVDPSATSTPVADAVAKFSNNYGTVLVPQGTITEGSTLNLKDTHTIRGVVPGNSTIHFTQTGTSADGIVVDGTAYPGRGGGLYGITVKGPGNGQTTGSALRFVGNTAVPRNFDLDKAQLIDWNGSANGAVVEFAAKAFELNWGYWSCWRNSGVQIDTSAGTAGVGPSSNLGTVEFTGSATELIHYVGGGRLHFDSINVGATPTGGSNGEVIHLNPYGNGLFTVGNINYEPSDTSAATATRLFHVVGGGDVKIGHAYNNNDTLDEIVFHGFRGGGDVVIGGTQNGGTLNNNHVVVGSDTAGGVRYDGITANVTNNAGTLTYPVHCLDGDVA